VYKASLRPVKFCFEQSHKTNQTIRQKARTRPRRHHWCIDIVRYCIEL